MTGRLLLDSCNYDSGSPKRSSNVAVMSKGSTDEAVVVVKSKTSEGMVTCLRIKSSVSDKDVGGKGWNMLTRFINFIRNHCCEISHAEHLLGKGRIPCQTVNVHIDDTTVQREVK